MAMGVNGVNPVLSHLDANKRVSASTWNRDVAAIQFIYRACGTLRWDWMMESKLGRNSIHKRAKARRNSHGHLLRMHAIHNQLVTPGDFGQQTNKALDLIILERWCYLARLPYPGDKKSALEMALLKTSYLPSTSRLLYQTGEFAQRPHPARATA